MKTLDAPTPISLLMARQVLYRSLSAAFVDPRSGNWPNLADPLAQQMLRAAAELVREEPSPHSVPLAKGDHRGSVPNHLGRPTPPIPPFARGGEGFGVRVSELGLGEHPLSQLDPAEMLNRLPPSPESLNAEFEQTFGLVAAGMCPPYETEYLPSKFTFQRSHHMADAAGFYRAFGLDLSRERPERPDHISLELEFMACLIGLERQAGERAPADNFVPEDDQHERIRTCRDAQRRFLREHLAWWVPTFARLLELENPEGFYAAAAHLLCAFLPSERALLGVDTTAQPGIPERIEPPDACTGCALFANDPQT